MIDIHPQYITDKKGNKLSVVIPVVEFEKLMEELEELEDIRLYDETKAAGDASMSVDEAFAMIEKGRKK
jgi:PHD/YefM family antitoxin component YafN of YafNO toxin-antitoxin module